MSVPRKQGLGCLASTRTLVLAALLVAVSLSAVPGSVLAARPNQTDPVVPRNVILFYDDYPSRRDPAFQVTAAIAMPLVAHLDQNGKATDWMFDSFIFYSLWLYETKKPTQSYIDSWIKYLFNGKQIANLDSTVAVAKAALGQPSYKMNVFLTIPVASNAIKADAILRNVNSLIDKWNKLNPSNLRLVGFYWGFTESLGWIKGLESIVPTIAQELHSKGFKLLMIPYLTAVGVDKLHSLGFDYVTLQPNYAWKDDAAVFQLANDKLIAGYVDGVEFELPTDSSVKSCGGDWRMNLETYFQQGYDLNWSKNIINTYYYGSSVSSMQRNGGADYLAGYEAIYNFISGMPPA
jgi:hypothetical protein